MVAISSSWTLVWFVWLLAVASIHCNDGYEELTNSCGIIGKPVNSYVHKVRENQFRYECTDGTVLVGSEIRTCNGSSYDSRVPICMPLFSETKFSQPENGSEEYGLINADLLHSQGIDRPFSLAVHRIYYSQLYVWMEKPSASLRLSTSQQTDLLSEMNYPLNGKHFYVFHIDKIVDYIRIDFKDSNHVWRISFADATVTVRCGLPDTPYFGFFQSVNPTVGFFHCMSHYVLTSSSVIKCVGLEKWIGGVNAKCVRYHFYWAYAVGGIVALFIVGVLFYLCVAHINGDTRKAMCRESVRRNIFSNNSDLIVEAGSISNLQFVETLPTKCSVFTGDYNGRLVSVHICKVDKSIDDVSGIRCLVQAVAYRYKYPYLVPLLGIASERLTENPMLINPFYGNGRLNKFLQSNRNLALDKMINILTDVASGMAYLHAVETIHRNLKAASCYVDESLMVKVGDFIYAHRINPTECVVTVEAIISRDRLPWVPPETIAHKSWSMMTDVWSFGVLMWEVFSFGQEPYQDKSELEITSLLLHEEKLSRPANCPENCYGLMLQCWSMVPEERLKFEFLVGSIRA